MIRFYAPADVQFTSKEGEVKIYPVSDLIEYVTGMLLNIDSEVVHRYDDKDGRYVTVIEIDEITSVKFHDGTLKETALKEMYND